MAVHDLRDEIDLSDHSLVLRGGHPHVHSPEQTLGRYRLVMRLRGPVDLPLGVGRDAWTFVQTPDEARLDIRLAIEGAAEVVITDRRLVAVVFDGGSIVGDLSPHRTRALFDLPWDEVTAISRPAQPSLAERVGERGGAVVLKDFTGPLLLDLTLADAVSEPPDVRRVGKLNASELMDRLVTVSAQSVLSQGDATVARHPHLSRLLQGERDIDDDEVVAWLVDSEEDNDTEDGTSESKGRAANVPHVDTHPVTEPAKPDARRGASDAGPSRALLTVAALVAAVLSIAGVVAARAFSDDDAGTALDRPDDADTVEVPNGGDVSATADGVEAVLAPAGDATADQLDQSVSIIRERLDAIGLAAADVTRQGGAIVVQLPQAENHGRALDLIGQTAEMRFRPVLVSGVLPVENGDLDLTPHDQDDSEAQVTLAGLPGDGPIKDMVSVFELGPAMATGEIVSAASADIQNGQWLVRLEVRAGADGIDLFNEIAALCYAQAPECPTGQLAIVLDSVVQSAPTIQQPSFTADQIQISGSFDEAEAEDLALVLRSGALPVELERQSVTVMSAAPIGDVSDVLDRDPPSPEYPPATTSPAALEVTTLIAGEGVGAQTGDTVIVHYVGVLADGTQFDSSWERGSPFEFTLGAGHVIRGWEDGLLGAKVGERRHLVIGSDNAYGPTGSGSIPPEAPLAFDVDVVDIRS